MDFVLLAYCYEIILRETKIKSALNLIRKNSMLEAKKKKEKVLVWGKAVFNQEIYLFILHIFIVVPTPLIYGGNVPRPLVMDA